MAKIESGLDLRISHLCDTLESITTDLKMEEYLFPHPVVMDEQVKFADWYRENQMLLQNEPAHVAKHLLETMSWLKTQFEKIRFRAEEVGRIIPEIVSELQQEIEFLQAKLAETEKDRDKYRTMVAAPQRTTIQVPIEQGEPTDVAEIPQLQTVQMTEELNRFQQEMRMKFEAGLAFVNPKTGNNVPKHPSFVANGMYRTYAVGSPEKIAIIKALLPEYQQKLADLRNPKKQKELQEQEDVSAPQPESLPQTFNIEEEESF